MKHYSNFFNHNNQISHFPISSRLIYLESSPKPSESQPNPQEAQPKLSDLTKTIEQARLELATLDPNNPKVRKLNLLIEEFKELSKSLPEANSTHEQNDLNQAALNLANRLNQALISLRSPKQTTANSESKPPQSTNSQSRKSPSKLNPSGLEKFDKYFAEHNKQFEKDLDKAFNNQGSNPNKKES